MTAAPVMSITEELIAELDALANANHAYVPVPPNTMRALLAERAELKRSAERMITGLIAARKAIRSVPVKSRSSFIACTAAMLAIDAAIQAAQ
jgi:uncharacterized protein YdeI (YjbR/CyaY-like superfamily)